jgi:hypothetical protein
MIKRKPEENFGQIPTSRAKGRCDLMLERQARIPGNQTGSNRIKPDQSEKKTSGGTLDDLAGRIHPVWRLGRQSKHGK